LSVRVLTATVALQLCALIRVSFAGELRNPRRPRRDARDMGMHYWMQGLHRSACMLEFDADRKYCAWKAILSTDSSLIEGGLDRLSVRQTGFSWKVALLAENSRVERKGLSRWSW
jgi:hypothetical protein